MLRTEKDAGIGRFDDALTAVLGGTGDGCVGDSPTFFADHYQQIGIVADDGGLNSTPIQEGSFDVALGGSVGLRVTDVDACLWIDQDGDGTRLQNIGGQVAFGFVTGTAGTCHQQNGNQDHSLSLPRDEERHGVLRNCGSMLIRCAEAGLQRILANWTRDWRTVARRRPQDADYAFRLEVGMIGLIVLERMLAAMRQTAARRHRLPQRAGHLEAGEQGELAALFHLRRQGFVIVARRWRNARQRGDLDLVAWEGNALCFVEVKMRSGRDGPSPESAMDEEKRQVLRRLSRLYVKTVDPVPERVRFDMVAVYPGQCLLYRGAFE